MIERIEWGHTHIDELLSAFMRGKGERPLRITLHSDSLAKLCGKEMEAVAVLREFGHIPEIQVFETSPGDYPHIESGDINPKENAISVQIVSGEQLLMLAAIQNARQLPSLAAHLVGQSNPDHQDARAMLDHLIIAEAHCSIHGDILVTSSPLLIRHRNKRELREANPRTPLEAAQIVGGFLRSRDIYIYAAGPKSKYSFDRGMFYWVLVRYRLPSMWRYFSACLAAGKGKHSDLPRLGESILVRCVRALEARDAIGIQFYLPQNKMDSDQMMYHFDYLTLVIAGALDAQARIAKIAYQIDLDDRWASFRGKEFVKALKLKGTQELHDFVNEQRFKDVTTLLYNLRNTIHAAALKIVTYQEEARPRHSLIEVPANMHESIWGAAERLGGPDIWGLIKKPFGIFLEPYSYATTLVEKSFSVIDAIATATDFKKLFPSNQPPLLTEAAPADRIFKWGERIALLA